MNRERPARFRSLQIKIVPEQRCYACGRINAIVEYETWLCLATCFGNYLDADRKVAMLIRRYSAALYRMPAPEDPPKDPIAPPASPAPRPSHSRKALKDIIRACQRLLAIADKKA